MLKSVNYSDRRAGHETELCEEEYMTEADVLMEQIEAEGIELYTEN